MQRSEKIVGHRGFPKCYPENTLLGFRQALEAGCDALECDVQFSRDATAFVCHDLSLLRCTGCDMPICELSDKAVAEFSAHEPARFGDRFAPEPIPTLAALVGIVQSQPSAHLFVELKHESFDYFPRARCLQIVLDVIAPIRDRVTIISFDIPVLELCRDEEDSPSIGWVLSAFDTASQQLAQRLQPEYLIIDRLKLGHESRLWPGAWDWFIYDVVDVAEMYEWGQRGARWIETWDAAELCV